MMKPQTITNICVVGASIMGTQIALQCAYHGYTIHVVEIADTAIKKAIQSQAQELQSRCDRQQITQEEMQAIINRIHFTGNLHEGASTADLVIESVPERLEIKQAIFSQLDTICPTHTLLSTNSSSIRISAIETVTERKDKVLNLHFYPPVWQRPMVEIMKGTKTSETTINTIHNFVKSIGLTPIPVLKESTGFVFNRIWRVIKKEALHLVDHQVASYEDIDRAWMLATGMAIGPFGLMDMVGLDVVRDIEMVYYRESGDEEDAPPEILNHKIAQNTLGLKTGKGFYTYPNPEFQNPSWLKGN